MTDKKKKEKTKSVPDEKTIPLEENLENETQYNSYLDDPIYDGFLVAYQKGEWEKCAKDMALLLKRYPLENELRHLQHDLQMRTRMDAHELVEHKLDKTATRKRFIKRLGIGALAVVVIGAILFVSAGWLQDQRQKAEEIARQLNQDISLSSKFTDASSLLQAERYIEALDLFEEIESIDPEFPNLADALVEARHLSEIEGTYQNALELIDQGEGLEALGILQAIALDQPYFKDVDQLINQLQKDYLLDGFLSEAEIEYEEENWIAAIENFESAFAIDPDLDVPGVEDKLFDSYIRGAELILTSPDLSLEDLETAEKYFRNSLSLRPQNREALERRADVNESISGLLAAGYVRAAQSFLIENSDSIAAMENASEYFGRALSLNPEAAEVQLQYKLARSYLAAARDFSNGLWSESINDLEYIYTQDRTYANGTAEQMLYEAYGARGNNNIAVGNFEAALDDFEQAVAIAQEDPDVILRLFEARINVAYALGRIGQHRDAVALYQDALDDSGVRDKAFENDPDLWDAIQQAEAAAARRDYRSAFVWYSDSLRGSSEVYFIYHHTVEEGDYLALLARQYNSTIQAIIEANNLTYPYFLFIDQILLIPSLR